MIVKTCPSNVSLASGYGNNFNISGPHHWVRVGKFPTVQLVPYSNEGAYVQNPDTKRWEQVLPLNGVHEVRVDKIIWECVYCLSLKNQE